VRITTSNKAPIAPGRYSRAALLTAVSVLLVLSFALSCLQVALAAPSSNADAGTWTTDGYVNTIVCRGDTTYIGGSFTGVGPPLKGGAALDALTGDFDLRPGFDATVKAAVSDGSGGWYVGGDFTQVLGVTRNRLAHIGGDGSLDPDWNPGATGSVNALELSADGNSLYVLGAGLRGQASNHLKLHS